MGTWTNDVEGLLSMGNGGVMGAALHTGRGFSARAMGAEIVTRRNGGLVHVPA